jgi:thiosulfate/3-mercaptopyruvate sulfurtransferase
MRILVRIIVGTALAFWVLAASAQETVDQRRIEMLVTTDWLATHLQDTDLVVLCVAEDDRFYSAGHIPGGRLIRLSEIVTTRDGIPNQLPTVDRLQRVFESAGVSNGSRIILYGERSGVLAARAYFTLDYLGLADRAALLDGGIEKWRAEGRPQSTDIPRIAMSNLRMHVRPEIVVDTPHMAEYSHTMSAATRAVLIDARPPLEYTGEKLSEDLHQAGHIPSAKNLYWRELLQDMEIPELRPLPELRNRFEAAGASPGREVITYCRTGMQSSFDYFIAKYLGYSPRMYVGSFYEWTRAPRSVESSAGRPVSVP